MTVQSQTSRADYDGNGLSTVFVVPFYFLLATDLLVIRTDDSTSPATVTTLVLGADYTVAGVASPVGGSITTAVAPTNTQRLSILRSVPYTQLKHYVPNDPFPAASHEMALDKLTMEVQQLAEVQSRALTLAPNTDPGVDPVLPPPVANSVIGWNETATALQNVDPETIATLVAYGNANVDIFYGNGVTTTFNLSENPAAQNNLAVSIAGVVQTPGVDYTWFGGTTLTFAVPPPNLSTILVRYMRALPQNGNTQIDTVQFIGGMGGDDAPALMALMNASPNKRIINVLGVNLNFYTTCTITTDNSFLDLNGGSIVQHTNDIDTLVFQPPTAGVTSAFRNGGGLANGGISCTLVPNSTGYALKLRQCNGFRMRDVDTYDGNVAVMGGQFSSSTGCRHFAAGGIYPGGGSALVHFMEAPYGAGQYQPCYTFEMHNWFASASKKRDAVIRVHAGDGVTIGSGYGANGLNAIVLVMSSRNGSYVGPLEIEGAYLDCVGEITGTANGIEIRNDGNPLSNVYSVMVHGGTIGNGTAVGVLCRKPETHVLTVDGTYIVNMTQWHIDVEGGTTLALTVTGCQLQRMTSVTGGSIRAQNGRVLNIAGNIFHNIVNICLSVSGTWQTGTIVGNTNTTAATGDISNIATFASRCIVAGNASLYVGAPGNTWQGYRLANVPSSDAFTLDYYAEGTFTPTVSFGGAAVGVVYAAQSGTYTRIGNRVFYELNVTLTSKGASVGALLVAGLPFASSASMASSSQSVRLGVATAGVGDTALAATVGSGSTGIKIDKMIAGFANQLTDADITNTSDIRISGHYMAA